ncbi:hypothetical protein B0H10DRAFT_2198533, partial [Mycena sp. CBHHK59/15]
MALWIARTDAPPLPAPWTFLRLHDDCIELSPRAAPSSISADAHASPAPSTQDSCARAGIGRASEERFSLRQPCSTRATYMPLGLHTTWTCGENVKTHLGGEEEQAHDDQQMRECGGLGLASEVMTRVRDGGEEGGLGVDGEGEVAAEQSRSRRGCKDPGQNDVGAASEGRKGKNRQNCDTHNISTRVPHCEHYNHGKLGIAGPGKTSLSSSTSGSKDDVAVLDPVPLLRSQARHSRIALICVSKTSGVLGRSVLALHPPNHRISAHYYGDHFVLGVLLGKVETARGMIYAGWDIARCCRVNSTATGASNRVSAALVRVNAAPLASVPPDPVPRVKGKQHALLPISYSNQHLEP